MLSDPRVWNRLGHRGGCHRGCDCGDLADELDGSADPRPAYQLQAIGEKRDNLVAVLGRRMDAGELTYARYQSTAQQVYLAVISNLREVAIARTSISAIDADYVDARLAELGAVDGPDAQAETSSLEDRRALAATQEAKITYLLAQNELAMTLLDRTSTALADAPIGLTPQATEAAFAALTGAGRTGGQVCDVKRRVPAPRAWARPLAGSMLLTGIRAFAWRHLVRAVDEVEQGLANRVGGSHDRRPGVGHRQTHSGRCASDRGRGSPGRLTRSRAHPRRGVADPLRRTSE